jgi:hypothetical protein
LQGFDYQNLQNTNTINYTFTNPVTNVGNLTTCNAISEFISYRVDSNPVRYFVTNIYATARATATWTINEGITISTENSSSPTTAQEFFLYGSTIVPGIYTSTIFIVSGTDIGAYGIQASTVNTMSYNLSAVGAIGQYIDLTFNGTFTNSTGSHTINGVVHVINE